jgi:hypothetical protein
MGFRHSGGRMKAYKVELLIIDFDRLGADGIQTELDNIRFANDCITPHIKKITEKDIGEWDDSHPLNNRTKCDEEYKRLFGE